LYLVLSIIFIFKLYETCLIKIQANSNAIYEDDFANLVEEIPDCPYKMWSLYFPKDLFKEQSEAHQLVEKFLMIIENSDKKFDIVTLD
jgi:hypothetical protein